MKNYKVTDAQYFIMDTLNKNEAILMPITPEPSSKPLECFSNVKNKCKVDGGKALYGWSIWDTPFYVEAEFHCVWSSEDESIVKDITPQTDGTKINLFLPDYETEYKGVSIPNKRVAKSYDPRVHNFLTAMQELDEFKASVMTPYSNEIKLNGENLKKYKEIMSKLNQAKIDFQTLSLIQ